jgi:methionine sulfoxide reductase heme-binding subunit
VAVETSGNGKSGDYYESMKLLSKRARRRFLRHHLVMAFVCITSSSLFAFAVQSPDAMFRWSMATAYVGLALLAATLTTGAFNVLRGRRNPVSTDLRRDIGIWCGIVSLIHVAVGWQVHMGNMLLYFFREAGEAKRLVPRYDLFGLANYAGLIAALLIVLLLALSNDVSLRRLGRERWKFFQRWNYAVVVLVALHGIIYQVIEKRESVYLILFGTLAGAVLLIQAAGFRHRKMNDETD